MASPIPLGNRLSLIHPHFLGMGVARPFLVRGVDQEGAPAQGQLPIIGCHGHHRPDSPDRAHKPKVGDSNPRQIAFHKSNDIIQFVERSPAPTLLPILRSRQQGEILAWLLDDADREASLTELSHRLRVPASSVHREIQRAERAGLIVSRRVGQTRLVRANKQSRFLAPLRQLLVMSFGVPERLASALSNVSGVQSAYIFGSWAARYLDVSGFHPVGDIDLLVLGDPDPGTWFTTKSRKWSPSWAIQSR